MQRQSLLGTIVRAIAGAVAIWLSIPATAAPLPASLAAAMQGSQLVLLGEVHDNAAGHALRRAWLAQALANGWRPALVFEQFERTAQAALDLARAECGRDAGCVIRRVRTPGWDWALYQPLVQLALDYQLPLVAAGIGREQMTALRRDGYAALFDEATLVRLQPLAVPAALREAQRAAIADGHCGVLPARAIDAMLPMQFARDMALAEALRAHQARGAVLIAGNGHVRRDVGVPRWLSPNPAHPLWVVGFVEDVVADERFDVQVRVPATVRDDPCKALQPS